ncbi:MAG TPA: sigma-70 family RNA polymerase sigma factor [Solirubrobacteraceae bacterium]|nr:sigma-70 family RNA polymerase sigma factor [Solirubrobacteraceae bacterium]
MLQLLDPSARAPARVRDRTDAALLAAVGERPEAIGVVYERWAPVLHARLVRQTGDGVLASEVVAETFAQALLHAGRFRDPGDGSAGPWLHGIATNVLHRAWRRNAVDARARRRLGLAERVVADDHADGAAERASAEARRAALERALASVPADQRAAVELRVVEGLEYAEIAERLGVKAATARVRVFRGLTALKAAMEREEER